MTLHGVRDATIDPDTIRQYWQETPNANIGLATGKKSGIVVVDIDNSPLKNGEASLKVLESQHEPLPDTIQSLTGGGGRHLFFGFPESIDRIRNRISACSIPGIDIRGDGGLIVAPTSLHESGKTYQWLERCSPDVMSPSPLPLWLLELLNIGPDFPACQTPSNMMEVFEGERNSKLTSIAGMLRAHGYGFEDLKRTLYEYNNCHCRPPLPEQEIEKIARSVVRYSPVTLSHLTDLGNAERFINRHGDRLRYCAALKKWFIYSGKIWKPDDTEEVITLASKTVTDIYAESAIAAGQKFRKELAKHARKSESEQRIKSMVNLARTNRRVAVSPEEFDTDPFLLNVENGVLDLKTGRLLSHDPSLAITKLAPVSYDPNATCDRWHAFLQEIFAGYQEIISYVQRVVGYALTGDISEQVMFILFGTGANGKSTFLHTLGVMLGDYVLATQPDTFLYTPYGRINNDIARLKGARLVTAVEPEGNKKLYEALVKQITGGDKISARFLYSEPFDFIPTFKIFLATNHKPLIQGIDYAIWRRIRLIPFKKHFPPAAQDHSLKDIFIHELPGILNWAIQGCIDWQRNGLRTPLIIEQEVQAYRDEMDSIGNFIRECCILGAAFEVKAKELFQKYQEWAFDKGAEQYSMIEFGRSLRERGFFTDPRKSTGYHWQGIKLI